jgi:hypothetical protein
MLRRLIGGNPALVRHVACGVSHDPYSDADHVGEKFSLTRTSVIRGFSNISLKRPCVFGCRQDSAVACLANHMFDVSRGCVSNFDMPKRTVPWLDYGYYD